MPRLVILVSAGMLTAGAAGAQQVNRLDCQGYFQGAAAQIAGMRQFVQTSALGDGRVAFEGQIAAAGMTGRIAYEGFTATAPFAGYIQGPLGTISIGVLDNTGGRMIIYGGGASLGPPTILGEFQCSWQ